ncbi:hypothetical protein [Sphingobium sp.]|uniref:hypothetical protein n=1 Tax=Sphingobium sp. TaxID=1912891 RepID=UPI002C927841|nr:hypothetical protein [Sphingobium sp.]HUD91312.1 hypothetical protein [Sphingobium sp.]
MRAQSDVSLSDFTVDVDFFSGDEHYATHSYTVTASTWFSARQQALQMSVNSVYDDPRIPGLSRTATVRTA